MASEQQKTVMDRIFGGPIVVTLLKLAALSLMVGLVFAAFGIDPLDLWRNFGSTIREAWALTFDALQWSFKYMILGAIVVLPLWILYRVLAAIAGRPKG
jgi:hypothetical protein